MRAVLSFFVWLWSAIVLFSAFFVVVATFIVVTPFDPGRYAVGRVGRGLLTLCVRFNPLWKFAWRGVRPENPRKPYVVVSNHESNVDPVLLSFLPFEMKFLSKKSIFQIPFLGWSMYLAGDISVDRKDKDKRGQALERCALWLKRRVSVMIFPEGTRARTEQMLPFKSGAFRLAIETGCDVLPVGIAGTRHMLPKGSSVFAPARATVVIGEPISVAGLTLEDVPQLSERAQRAIETLRAEAQQHSSG